MGSKSFKSSMRGQSIVICNNPIPLKHSLPGKRRFMRTTRCKFQLILKAKLPITSVQTLLHSLRKVYTHYLNRRYGIWEFQKTALEAQARELLIKDVEINLLDVWEDLSQSSRVVWRLCLE